MPVLALTKLSPIMAGFLLACAFSAIMSTASALLLVIGSGAGSDLYHGFINPKASEKKVMRVTQVSTYVLGLISAVLCFAPIFQVGIYQVTWIAWSVLSPAFIPLIIGGLYWKRGTKEGAYASLIVGSVTGFAWYYLLQESTNIHTFFAAIVLATVAYVVVSLLTKEPPRRSRTWWTMPSVLRTPRPPTPPCRGADLPGELQQDHPRQQGGRPRGLLSGHWEGAIMKSISVLTGVRFQPGTVSST